MKRILLMIISILCVASIVGAVADSQQIDRNGKSGKTKMLLQTGGDSGSNTTLTAAGEITVYESFVIIDTYGAAATDTLVTINAGAKVGKYDGVKNGDMVTLRSANSGRDITISEAANIDNQGVTVVLSDTGSLATYHYDSNRSKWQLFSYNDWYVVTNNVAAGSATAPSIILGGDTNTGPFLRAADHLAFSIGGADRFSLTTTTLKATENVTIKGTITGTSGVTGVTGNFSTSVTAPTIIWTGAANPVLTVTTAPRRPSATALTPNACLTVNIGGSLYWLNLTKQ